jgi:hypothetical protein
MKSLFHLLAIAALILVGLRFLERDVISLNR